MGQSRGGYEPGGDMSETITERRQLASAGMGLAWFARTIPDRVAILSPHGNRTYAELNAAANQLARAMRRRGAEAKDGLALACSNRAEFSETLNAASRTGLRSTLLNWHLTGEEMAYILNDCEATVFVADARFGEAAAEAAKSAPHLVAKFAIGGDIEGFERYEAVLAEESPEDIDDPVPGTSMLYTSGTTGRPKGVKRPPAAAASQTTIETARDPKRAYREGDVHLLTGPAYHAAPYAQSVIAPIAAGVTIVMMDGWDPEETLRLIDEHKVTHTHMVATMFHRLLGLPEEVRNTYDTSSLRQVMHGAAPCPVEVKQAMMDWWGPVIYEYYAATEGGGTTVGPEEWLQKPGTVGRAGVGQTVEVWDEQGTKCPVGVVGTVYMKKPDAGGFEYHNDPAKTAGAYKGDFFTLGDMGYFDEDDYLFLTGRSADLIISGGVNIYPVEVDGVLLQHPAVADVATVGVPNTDWGEEVRAVVQVKPGIDPSPELAAELVAFVRDRLAHYKCPRSVDFSEVLPRHDSGKIYRRLVRDPYWAGRDKQI